MIQHCPSTCRRSTASSARNSASPTGFSLDQERIDTFARCTGDDQWIHVDVERASRESPYRSTIAHGYLTLSLLGPAALEVWIRPAAIPRC